MGEPGKSGVPACKLCHFMGHLSFHAWLPGVSHGKLLIIRQENCVKSDTRTLVD